tara:strand:- start:375 stop:524 length:150 start_codon:yes stop_codon:yes gene_type:complete
VKIPDYQKIIARLSQDSNNDYASMSNDDLLYEYIKTFGNKVPLTKKEKE